MIRLILAVHTNRVVRDLREMGLIISTTRAIAVKNWRGLAALADFDPTYLH